MERSPRADRLEVMFLEVPGDLLAKNGTLRVGCAEVDAGPHSSVYDFLERVREPLEAPSGTRFVAERANGNLIRIEEVRERVYERASPASVARGWSGKGGVTCAPSSAPHSR